MFARCTQLPSQSVGRSNTSSTGTSSSSNAQDGATDPKKKQGAKIVKGTGSGVETSSSPNTIASISPSARTDLVSAFELDDPVFLITRFTVGLQPFLNSQTPVLSFDLPPKADYVEIMRCPTNAVLSGVSTTISLKSISLSTVSSTDKANLFRNNDFWGSAISAGCGQLTTGATGANFYDSWAASGSYSYLIRACVSPERMSDTSQLSSRNCTRQIAVSDPLPDYTNKRIEAQRVLLQKANQASGDMLTTLAAVKQKADEEACYIQWCECGANSSQQSICQRDEKNVPAPCKGGEHGKQVAKAKKAAITNLVAVALDLALNFATTKVKGGGVMGVAGAAFGTAMSLNGMTFDSMFQKLATTVQDFPATCAQGIAMDQELAAGAKAVIAAKAQYDFYACRALAAKYMTTASAGGDTTSTAEADFANCPTTTEPPPSSEPDTTGGGIE